MTRPRIGSLFSGAGMLDEGVRAVLGGTVAWHAEIDPAASKVLAYRYPDVPNLGDITAINWRTVSPIDLLTAGYPCQPFSDAGQRKAEDDPRYLWPQVARAIRELGPRLVVLENVRGHLVRGFARVVGELSMLGYDAQWTTVRASDVGAPHRRERLFVIAWPTADTASAERRGAQSDDLAPRLVTAAEPRERASEVAWGQYEPAIRRWESLLGRPAPAPTEPSSRGGQRLSPRFVEFMMGWPDGWVTDVPGITRNDALKICGNGVVPQQAAAALRVMLAGQERAA